MCDIWPLSISEGEGEKNDARMTLNYLFIVVLLQNSTLSSFGHNTVVMKLIEADEVNGNYLDFSLLSHMISWSFSVMMCNRSIPGSCYLCWATRGWKGRCTLKILSVSDLTLFLTANLFVSFLPSPGCPCPAVVPPHPQSLTTIAPFPTRKGPRVHLLSWLMDFFG